jgi:dTDP-4-dehydrorhamnose reductase
VRLRDDLAWLLMSKVLISGGSGLLALNWALRMRDSQKIVLGLHAKKVSLLDVETTPLSLSSLDELIGEIEKINPDIVVHTAGMTNVNDCENSREQAFLVNGKYAENIAIACTRLGKKLVHISTDHLFSGDSSYKTEDLNPSPVNVYASSKLYAEKAVVLNNPDALIIRTNFFGWGHRFKRSFSDWIIDSLRDDKKITLFKDVYFTPILIDTLVELIHQLLSGDARGVYNVVSDERISKYDFGCMIADVFNLQRTLIQTGNLSNTNQLVHRPLDMSLDNLKVKKYLNLSEISLKKQFDLLMLQYNEGRPLEIENAIREN